MESSKSALTSLYSSNNLVREEEDTNSSSAATTTAPTIIAQHRPIPKMQPPSHYTSQQPQTYDNLINLKSECSIKSSAPPPQPSTVAIKTATTMQLKKSYTVANQTSFNDILNSSSSSSTPSPSSPSAASSPTSAYSTPSATSQSHQKPPLIQFRNRTFNSNLDTDQTNVNATSMTNQSCTGKIYIYIIINLALLVLITSLTKQDSLKFDSLNKFEFTFN